MMIQSAWHSIAPRTRWTVATVQTRQRIFVVVLRADGLEDFELPVNTINLRLRDVSASYVRVTVSNPVDYVDEIVARIDGRMHIFSRWLTADGVRHVEELIYANIQNLYYAQGSTNVLTLAGTRYITHSSPRAATIEKVSRIARSGEDRVTVRAPLDFFIRPRDVVTAESETFEVDYMGCTIQPADAYMDVEGVA